MRIIFLDPENGDRDGDMAAVPPFDFAVDGVVFRWRWRDSHSETWDTSTGREVTALIGSTAGQIWRNSRL